MCFIQTFIGVWNTLLCEEMGGIGGEETVTVVGLAMVMVLSNNNIIPTLDCIDLFGAVSLFVCVNYFKINKFP